MGLKSAINTQIDDYIDRNDLKIPRSSRNNHYFQSNYLNDIVENNIEYQRIKNHIVNNPLNWVDEKIYS